MLNENIRTEELGLPGMTSRNTQGINLNEYSVKYFKADLGSDEDRTFLQDIETRGVHLNGGVMLLSRDKMSFMDRYFVIVQYLEKV